MTHQIPHGVYLKLEKIPGIYIKTSDVSGRDLFHFKLGYQEYSLVDNGYNNYSKTFWRFFNYNGGSFNFGTEYLPLKVMITDRAYSFSNAKGQTYTLVPDGGKIFLAVLEAYYGKGLPNIIIDDKRRENLISLINHKRKVIDDKKKEIDLLSDEIHKIDMECRELNDEVTRSCI